MEKEKIKRIQKMTKRNRIGTPTVICHKLNFSVSQSAVKKVLGAVYFNEKIVKAAEKINVLSDDQFAVAFMKAQRAFREHKEKFASK